VSNGRRIPDELLEEIKAKSDIVDVVEQYVTLSKKTGANFFGLCPFHSEDTPSFSVSPGKQIFYCFGCHTGGDVINFIREIEKVPYRRALEILAERAGVRLPANEDPKQQERYRQRDRLFAANTEAARYFYHALNGAAGAGARAYLKERGISRATAVRFGLGYAPDEWTGLLDHLSAKGFSDGEIEKSGLFRLNRSNNRYDLFRDRLMFPIIDQMGHIVAFGGRIMGEGMPKYINSPETQIYTKGQVLYGLNLAKKSKAGHLLLVEGYMDTISLHQAGVDCAVAVLGTALTEAQVRLMRRYTNEVIVGFDSDRAGQAATERSFELLNKQEFKVKVLMVPDGMDPDDYIRANGEERFRAVLNESKSLLDYKFHMAQERNTVQGTLDPVGYQEEICHILLTIDNAIIYELYLAQAAQTLGTLVDAVRREVDRLRRKSSAAPTYHATRSIPPPQPPPFENLPEPPDEPDELMEPDRRESYVNRNEAHLLVLLSRNPDAGPPDSLPDYRMFTDSNPDGFPARALERFREKELTTSGLLNLADEFFGGEIALRDQLAGILVRLPDRATDDHETKDIKRLSAEIHLDFIRGRRDQLATKLDREGSTAEDQQNWREELARLNKLYNELRGKQ
jgi:DNA primase